MWNKRIISHKVNAKCLLGIGVLLDEAARSPGGPSKENYVSARHLHLSQQKVTFLTSNAVQKRKVPTVPINDIINFMSLNYRISFKGNCIHG